MTQDRVIALGFFDGVHRGHAALLTKARQTADRLGCCAAVLTFSNHPDELVFGCKTPLINSLEDRRELMTRKFGIQEVVSIPFDRALMQTPWEEFVDKLLVEQLHAVHVVCGHDFTFGNRGEGTPQRLKEKCTRLGIGCDVIEKVVCHHVTVSSTYIRQLLQKGDVAEANALLGHRHFFTGTVVPGKRLGRSLGIPTANLRLPDGILAPAFGVYAAEVLLEDGRRFPAVTNVGVCPTVEQDTGVTVEPWLLDFDGDLYGQTIRVEFCQFLRPERKFGTLEELRREILRNAQQTRDYFDQTQAAR